MGHGSKSEKKHVNYDVLTKRQIRNMVRGIGCANCGSPSTRKYQHYDVCDKKKCMQVLMSIWKSNHFARLAGNSK
jgi:hypothetical protein